jgi:hypothetical protein
MMRELIVTEPGGIRSGKDFHKLGDTVRVDEVTAKRWLRAGWARDPATGEQHPRDTSHKVLDVHS